MQIIPITNQGGATYKVNLGSTVYSFQFTFNYTIECWTMNILDSVDVPVLSGLMLVPDIDLLDSYPSIKEQIGTLTVIEKNTGDYKIPNMLGSNVQLTWYPPI